MSRRLKLTLSRKAIILVSIPLAFQLLFVSALLTLLNQAETERAREAHARDVATHANTLLRLLLDAGTSSVLAYMLHSGDYQSRYRKLSDNFHQESLILKRLVRDNEHERETFARMEVLNDECMRGLAKAHECLVSDDRDEGVRQWLKMQRDMKELFRLADGLVEEQQSEQLARKEAQTRYRESAKNLIYGAVAFNILLAFALVAYYNRGTTRRLNLLVDNTNRLASSKPLSPPIKGDADEIALLDATFREMARSLAEALRKERAAVDNAVDVICSLDADLRIAAVNPACEKAWGYAGSEIVGMRVSQVLHEEDQPGCLAMIKKIMDGGSEETFESRVRRKDGSYADMLWAAQWSAEEKSLFCVLHDISERKRIDRLKQDFVAMVSHDLRTPLTSVAAFLELLEANAYGELNDSGKKSLAIAESNIERVVSMVSDILDMEKLESGMLVVLKEPVELRDVLNDSVASVSGYAGQKGVKITSAAFPQVRVLADRDRLIQVVVNLLGNAVKFSSEGARVVLKATLTNSMGDSGPGRAGAKDSASQFVQVEVIDQGAGIPEDKRDFVFERFRQLDGQAGMKDGSGLGLSICRALVEAHGGEIGVRAGEGGKGSCFWFKLPVLEE